MTSQKKAELIANRMKGFGSNATSVTLWAYYIRKMLEEAK